MTTNNNTSNILDVAAMSDEQLNKKAAQKIGVSNANKALIAAELLRRAELIEPEVIDKTPVIPAASNNNEAIFKTLELNDTFRANVDMSRAALAMNEPAQATALISAEKARLTNINRVNRDKRFKKIVSLHDGALNIIALNSNADTLEKTAIYSVDKVIQAARFLAGESAVFGRGKNNTLLYALRGIAKHEPAVIDTAFIVNSLMRYGQPAESAQTQASSSMRALLALNCVAMLTPGKYTVNKDSELMTLLLTEYAK